MSYAKNLLPSSKKKMDQAQGKAIIQLSKKVNRLYKANQVDTHYVDIAQTLTPGTTAAVGVLSSTGQGNTENDRDGDATALKFLQFSSTVVPNPSSGTDTARLIIFRWKAPAGGTAPTASQVLQVATNVDSPYNRDYRDSLVVLKDTKLDASIANGTKNVSCYKKLNNIASTYVTTIATGYNENHIYFLFLATDNTNKTSFNYWSRITFMP